MLFIWCFDSLLAPYPMNSFFLSFCKFVRSIVSGKPSKNGIVLNAINNVASHDLQDGDIISFAPETHILYLAPKLT